MKRSLGMVLALFGCALPLAAQQAVVSPHGPLRPSIDCGDCHTASAWKPLAERPSFDHGRDAGFVLDGRHARLRCVACHTALRFEAPRAAPEQCAACHQDPHRGRLSSDCARCHDSRGFQVARDAAVHETTTFPLAGAHRVVACEACHRDERAGAFTPVDARCIACHRSDLAQARFPDHTSPLFKGACDQCHRPTAWQGARFDHEGVSGFALIGAHVRAECTGCHAPPDFRLRFNAASPQDCVACHRADYDRVHTGTGFPLLCTNCHTAERWSGARFDHSFPIFQGRHAGKWDTCADCHNVPGNFTVFTCLTCHTRAETDSHHREEPGYAYESPRCLSCHPRGEAD